MHRGASEKKKKGVAAVVELSNMSKGVGEVEVEAAAAVVQPKQVTAYSGCPKHIHFEEWVG